MKSKLLVTVLSVFVFFLGSQGDVRNYDVSSIELPPPPNVLINETPEAEEEGDESGISRIMATASNNPGWINCGGKLWVNYDFNSQTIAQNNVDWPITIIFYGNANINKVKNIFDGYPGSWKYAAYDIGSGTQWDRDGGTKIWVLFGGMDGYDLDTLHLRLYAPPSTDYFDGDSGWGHYVIASTHFDFDPPWDTKCGYSEDAEHMALQYCADIGYTVYYDWIDIGNYESLRNENNHWWQSDGYVSLVYVP